MGKGDRTENPAREYQKEERKRELERNKAQRQMSREVHKLQHAPSYQVRSELQKLMDLDKAGKLNSTLRAKMGALQGVYKDALIREQTNPSAAKPVPRVVVIAVAARIVPRGFLKVLSAMDDGLVFLRVFARYVNFFVG